jgi:hypothetical protein
MNGAVGEISNFLRMAQCKYSAASGVAGVGGGSSVALADRVSHSFHIDRANQTSPALHQQLAVPGRGIWQPDLSLDLRIGRWPERDREPAFISGLCCCCDVSRSSQISALGLCDTPIRRGEEKDGEQQRRSHLIMLIPAAIRATAFLRASHANS